jgi:hypothetical protein
MKLHLMRCWLAQQGRKSCCAALPSTPFSNVEGLRASVGLADGRKVGLWTLQRSDTPPSAADAPERLSPSARERAPLLPSTFAALAVLKQLSSADAGMVCHRDGENLVDQPAQVGGEPLIRASLTR